MLSCQTEVRSLFYLLLPQCLCMNLQHESKTMHVTSPQANLWLHVSVDTIIGIRKSNGMMIFRGKWSIRIMHDLNMKLLISNIIPIGVCVEDKVDLCDNSNKFLHGKRKTRDHLASHQWACWWSDPRVWVQHPSSNLASILISTTNLLYFLTRRTDFIKACQVVGEVRDHMLPRWLTLADSQCKKSGRVMNATVCHEHLRRVFQKIIPVFIYSRQPT